MRKSFIILICFFFALTLSMNLSHKYDRASEEEECTEGHYEVHDCTDCKTLHCEQCDKYNGEPCNKCYNDIERELAQCKCRAGYVQVDTETTKVDHDCIDCTKYLCKECNKDPNDCTECSDDTRDLAKKCECKEGMYQYVDENGQISTKCKPCPCGCKNCQQVENGSEKVKCLDCHNTYSKNVEDICKCPSGTYDPYENTQYSECREEATYPKECKDCDKKCQTCKTTADNCIDCKDQSFRETPSNCPCKEGYGQNPEPTKYPFCDPCPIGCKSCTDPSCCDYCDANKKRKQDTSKSCECICEDGYYAPAEKVAAGDGTCEKCKSPCSKCTETCCLECIIGALPYKLEDCKCTCGEGFYDNGQGCSPCIANCKICDNDKTCKECYQSEDTTDPPRQEDKCNCPLQYQMDKEGISAIVGAFDPKINLDPKCNWCPLVCMECECDLVCTKCRPNRELKTPEEIALLGGKLCESNCCCPEGQYEKEQTKECTKCPKPSNCLDCTQFAADDHPNCITCKDNDKWEKKQVKYEDDTTAFICVCKDNYFMQKGDEDQCVPCHTQCDTCNDGGFEDCKTCKLTDNRSYVKIDNVADSTGQCDCPSGYGEYITRTENACYECKKTDDHCLECEFDAKKGADPFRCKKCVSKYEVGADGHCTCTLPCTDCEFPCDTCSPTDKFECTDCRGDRILLNEKLGELGTNCKCPDKTFHENDKENCTPCKKDCKTCIQADECKTCENGQENAFTPEANPFCKCPPGYQPKGDFPGECKKCDDTCGDCEGPDPIPCKDCAQNCEIKKSKPEGGTDIYTISQDCYKKAEFYKQTPVNQYNCICNREKMTLYLNSVPQEQYITDLDQTSYKCTFCHRQCLDCKYFPWDTVRKSCNCKDKAKWFDLEYIQKLKDQATLRTIDGFPEMKETDFIKYLDGIIKKNKLPGCDCQPGYVQNLDASCKSCEIQSYCNACTLSLNKQDSTKTKDCCVKDSCKFNRITVEDPDHEDCHNCICPPGTVEDSILLECPKCDWRCKRCKGDAYSCEECVGTNRLRDPDTTNKNCPCDINNVKETGFFYEKDEEHECLACPKKCTCCQWNSASKQIDCGVGCCAAANNIQRINAPKCDCPPGFWSDPSKDTAECKPCSPECETCQDSADNCVTCPLNAHIEQVDEYKKTCKCNEKYYRNEQDPYCCDPCPFQCKTCFQVVGKDFVQCGDCYGNRVKNEQTGQCLCPEKTYDDFKSLNCVKFTANLFAQIQAIQNSKQRKVPTMKKLNYNN